MPSQELFCLAASCTRHYKIITFTLTPAQIDSYTWEANGWEQGMYSLKIQWASEQWNLPEKLEKHLWLDKIGESQTYHFLTFSFGGWWIAISHQVLLYSRAAWWHQINMKFSRALFDPEGHSAISPWFSIKKMKRGEGGRKKKRKRKGENFLLLFSLRIPRWSICLNFMFVSIDSDSLFLFQKEIPLMPLLYLPNSSSVHVFVANFLNISKSTVKPTLRNSLFLEHRWIKYYFLKLLVNSVILLLFPSIRHPPKYLFIRPKTYLS